MSRIGSAAAPSVVERPVRYADGTFEVKKEVCGSDAGDEGALEAMAAIEHQQWVYWASYMLNNATPENLARWRELIETPYDQLADYDKEADRTWARKALAKMPSTSFAQRALTQAKPSVWTEGQSAYLHGTQILGEEAQPIKVEISPSHLTRVQLLVDTVGVLVAGIVIALALKS